ncbi:DNA polymerase IV [Actinomyces sp. F1_1611]
MSTAPRSDRAKRDWGDDDSATTILHVDMDSFFASVEVVENPSLAGVPLIVGGLGNRGVVTSCTYDVRALGVRAGMPIGRARALAPQAVVVPGSRGLYRDYSHRVMEILSAITPDFEPISIDEAFLDVAGARRRLGQPREIAQLIRNQIRERVSLPASVGIGNSKTVAKIASSHAKPDGVLLIPAERTVEFLQSLPVGALPGIGRKTQELLDRRGLSTVGQLAELSVQQLGRIVGEAHAYDLHRVAWGEDRRRVGGRAPEKSISTEETFPVNLTERKAVERYLLAAAHDCAARLRDAELVAWTVQIKLRDADFRTITRAQTLTAPTDLGREVAAAALRLFAVERLGRGGVRLAGVGVTGLRPRDEGVQIGLDEDLRPLAAERTMDRVHSKFGRKSLQPATLLGETASLPREKTGEVNLSKAD